MVKREFGIGRNVRWRSLLIAACAGVATLWTSAARATITQGDFSVFGYFESRESGRWGESSQGTGTSTVLVPNPGIPGLPPAFVAKYGASAGHSGGSYDFAHWDLVQARQLADVRPDYHMVKNYKFLGRFDTLVLRDADFFAFYRPWYDAEGTIKDNGVLPPSLDWPKYNQAALQQEYFRNDLHEYYAQLNFTDNFSMRVGKQQIIWSEADALSGTELTNSVDTTYHWINFESPEDLRKNVRMVKFNYILPDFLKTSNNEVEAGWIPGDYEGNGLNPLVDEPRNPWSVQLPLASMSVPTMGNVSGSHVPFPNQLFNAQGVPYNGRVLASQAWPVPLIPVALAPGLNVFAEKHVYAVSSYPSNSIDNSEFAARVSSLLPIGNGLQMSLIFLYEARLSTLSLCTGCNYRQGPKQTLPPAGPGGVIVVQPGVYLLPGVFDLFNKAPNPATFGTVRVPLSQDFRRNPFFGTTGTYYDKEITDIVYRYDALYAPRVGAWLAAPNTRSTLSPASSNYKAYPTSSAWTEESRFIIAGDRPTYIPWLSKQHTFITFQYVNTWYPDRPPGMANALFETAGKTREDNNLGILAFTNWLVNGQLTATNFVAWDIDDNVGQLASTNVYRYSRNILLGLNATMYIGRSGRFTDPFLFSADQRNNELEATFTYEI